jgi:hypothetical protein
VADIERGQGVAGRQTCTGESVIGEPGRRVPGPRDLQLVEPAGPEGTFAEEDGGLNGL